MINALKGLSFALYFIVAYSFVYGVLIFNLPLVTETDLSYDADMLNTPSEAVTYAYLLEELQESLDVRLALVGAAQTRINISYYTIHGGVARDLFFGSLLEAADRGVEINLIIDEVFYHVTSDDKKHYEAIMAHENITFRFYEPINPFLPHTLQNRLHDKLLIIDDTYGVIGGRNIGDRYYGVGPLPEYRTFDRDVLIFGADDTHQTVVDMNDYYEELFNSRYAFGREAAMTPELSEEQTRMWSYYQEYASFNELDLLMDRIRTDAIQVERATFLRSPLERMHKHPVILETLGDLAAGYDTWIIQSPYIVFSDLMRRHLPDHDDHHITVLTNSPAVSPNVFAMAGYMRYRTDLARATDLYEFHGEFSLHGKSMVFGDEISVIGSLNLDPRSATLSTESVMVIYSEPFTTAFKDVLGGYIDQSLTIRDDGSIENINGIDELTMDRRQRFALRLMYYVTYFFDPML